MEEITKNIVSNDPSWSSKLKQFNTSNSSSTTFADRYGVNAKRSFVKSLVDKLFEKNQPEQSDLSNILEALRILAREEIALEPLENDKLMELVMGIGQLNHPEEKSTVTAASEEALKLLVNLVVKVKGAKQSFLNAEGALKIVDMLKLSDINMPRVFPLCRILFHVSLEKDVNDQLRKQNAVDHLLKLLSQSVAGNDHPSPVTTSDILKVIFNLTMHLGPLNGSPTPPTTQEVEQTIRLAPLIRTILFLPSGTEKTIKSLSDAKADSNYQLKLSSLNCLINIPADLVNKLIEPAVVEKLYEILQVQLKVDNNEEGLVVVLIVLTGIARSHADSRQWLKERVYPTQQPQEVKMEAPVDDHSIASILRAHFTSATIALKHYTQEFLFALCNQDGKEFARLNGLGPSAGLLAEKNLMSTFSHLTPERTSQAERDQRVEELEENSSDEEREAEELAEKLQRLEQLGVFKVMRDKKDQDPQK